MTWIVNGLRLPESLANAIREERWVPRLSKETARAVFPNEKSDLLLYGIDAIINVNKLWANETAAWAINPPGSTVHIRVDRSVLIGDVGADQMIALNYESESDPNPAVIYLSSQGWAHVAEDIEELLDKIERATDGES